MILRHPEWLALFPVLLIAGWWMPRLAVWRPLRIFLLGLITLILAQPQWRRLTDGVDLWVLLDSSVSAEKPMAKGLPEWEKLLEQSRGPNDRLFQLNYAGEVMRRGAEGAELYDRQRQATRTGLAITQALAHTQRESAGRPARMLIFTDGYSTEPLTGSAEKLKEQGIELDFLLARDPEPTDYRVAALRVPAKAQLGEPFLIEIEVRGTRDGKVPIKVLRQGREIQSTDVEVRLGTGILRLTDRLGSAGVAHYEALIQPVVDAHPGNNRHEAMIEIAGGPRVLLLTAYTDDPVATTLQRQGFTVEKVTELRSIRPGQLAGAKCVILNNVPAFELPGEFLAAMDFYVREQGGSLLMAGGQKSFAAGGYFESAIDSLLPVSMELKQEHRKLMVAMGIVMDRSGSMSMTVKNGFTKMALADEGAANAIRFLGPHDLLTVFAVDSEAHQMVPLQPVGPNRAKMESAVRRIESTGGGIYVYNGLKAAWDELKNAAAGQRHIILFSDAADSEQPDDYKNLITEIVANGGTISVIALGTRGDPDAAFLEDIATRGKGRLFFTDKAEELPSIFSQETVAVARSAFIRDPVKTQAANGWFEITSQPLDWLPEADGYNLSYIREWASQALITQDEYGAPLVSFGQRGIGRTAAVSFPLGGEFSDKIRAWPKYGDFLQTMTRWLMGEQLPPGIGLKHGLQGTVLTLDLLHDETWEQRLMTKAPRIVLAHGTGAGSSHEIAWERLSPGHYQARVDLPEGEMVRGAVQVGNQALSFGPAIVGTSTEWAFDETRTEELKQVSLASGGRELLELSQAWRSPRAERFVDLRNELLTLALILMLVEALITRTGWRLPVWAFAGWKLKPARVKPAVYTPSPSVKETIPAAEKKAAESIPGPPEPEVSRQSRFDRAKRR
ncbi:von Willebrand factor type A domain-containing protein [Prosthecobacter fusiformis]|uniref:von Willebrand factor type A domain-containing protein n=1 Tax=Prosthecobacter fusiformis TaxID=48464 RepID=A0A4R7RTI3_9BACT|nr:VWA domain-containing protein [Prosthecobacter fusiformis]TDU68095.1 von Willebrand factor type A domain-containing protein [Prosthecobacter fusiformis]